MAKLLEDNVLIIGDSHLPFEHRNYLEFCKGIQQRCKCKKVVHIGDFVDNHAISYHEHDPDGWSPANEMEEADNNWTDMLGDLMVNLENIHLSCPKIEG